jgi:putative transcriptional regulator
MKMDVYKSIMTGLNEAVGYEKGAVKARKIKCTVNPVPDFSAQEIKSVRNNLQMTQATFAVVMGVSKKQSKRGRSAQTGRSEPHAEC